MENKKNNGLVVAFIVILVVAVIGIGGTIYFYNKSLSKNNNENNNDNNIIDNNKSKTETGENNNLESLKFTELTKYTLKNGEEKKLTKNGKEIFIKRKSNETFTLNYQGIYSAYDYFYVTDYFIMFISGYGQMGETYEIYDFNGNLLDKKTVNDNLQLSNLRLENNKLVGDYVNTEIYGDDGFIVEKTYIFQCGYFEITEETKPKFNKSEYTELINRHENDVLNGIYEIKYVDNKIKYDLLSAKETVKTFLEKNSNSLCVTNAN